MTTEYLLDEKTSETAESYDSDNDIVLPNEEIPLQTTNSSDSSEMKQETLTEKPTPTGPQQNPNTTQNQTETDTQDTSNLNHETTPPQTDQTPAGPSRSASAAPKTDQNPQVRAGAPAQNPKPIKHPPPGPSRSASASPRSSRSCPTSGRGSRRIMIRCGSGRRRRSNVLSLFLVAKRSSVSLGFGSFFACVYLHSLSLYSNK